MDVPFVIACCTAALVILTPVFLFLWTRSVVTNSPYPYCFNLLSSGLWIIYGARHELAPVYFINTIGVLANGVYIAVFLRFSARADHRRRYLVYFLVAAVFVFAVIMLIDVASHHGFDHLCSVVSVLASLAPFINMLTVPWERRREAMPSPLVPGLAGMNAIVWTGRNIAGVPLHDINLHLVVPSAAAGLCAIVLLGLHIVFWVQGPPPPPTGIRRPLIIQDDEEGADDEGAGREGEIRLDVVESSTGNRSNINPPPPPPRLDQTLPIETTKPVEEKVPAGQTILPVETAKPAEEKEPEGQTILPVETANPAEQKEPQGQRILPVETTAKPAEEEEPAGQRILPVETAKPAEEKEPAGQMILDHTPAVTSTKDEESEAAQPHGDGAAA